MRFVVLCFVWVIGAAGVAWAKPCVVLDRSSQPLQNVNFDPLYELLKQSTVCPDDVFKFRDAVKSLGLFLTTTVVANRDFHNSTAGSFSLFEMVQGRASTFAHEVRQGDFFFGHFTRMII